MTHQVSARYDEADRTFVPPFRTLGFNPQLRLNDSVLAQSYVEAYDISYPEAMRRIEAEVNELKQVLSENGSYVMEDLGTLSVNQEGNYEFIPCEAGVLSPTLYGLDTFSFKRLKDSNLIEVDSEVKKIPVAKEVPIDTPLLDFTDDSTEESTITIRMSWVRNAVAVAAAVVAFFLMSTPVANSDLGTQSMSQLQQNLLYKLIPQDTNIVPAEPVAEPVAAEETDPTSYTHGEQLTPAVQQAQPAIVVKTNKTTYLIVVASQVKRSNAQLFVDKLKAQGYNDARVFIRNNVVRVISGEYDTQEEAYRMLNKMNSKQEFSEAWVYKNTAEV